MRLPRVKEGDPITDGLFNRLGEAARACDLSVSQGGGLLMTSDPSGIMLSTAIPCPIWGRITGPVSGGVYPFTEQFPAAGGTWTAGSLSDVAVEANGNASVPTNTYARLWWTSAGEWRFQAGSC